MSGEEWACQINDDRFALSVTVGIRTKHWTDLRTNVCLYLDSTCATFASSSFVHGTILP